MTSTETPPAAPAQEQPPTDEPPAKPETDWKAEAKKWESRAKENKSAADRLAELEDANKSELDKALDRVTKAEAEVATVPSKVADALRTHLVVLHEISTEDAELFLTATDPELLLKQVQRLTGRAAERKKPANHVPREGNTPRDPQADELREFARDLFQPAE